MGNNLPKDKKYVFQPCTTCGSDKHPADFCQPEKLINDGHYPGCNCDYFRDEWGFQAISRMPHPRQKRELTRDEHRICVLEGRAGIDQLNTVTLFILALVLAGSHSEFRALWLIATIVILYGINVIRDKDILRDCDNERREDSDGEFIGPSSGVKK
jgi:hypothetical protein